MCRLNILKENQNLIQNSLKPTIPYAVANKIMTFSIRSRT